jgi:Flp pilus assembly pilin Flp
LIFAQLCTASLLTALISVAIISTLNVLGANPASTFSTASTQFADAN